MKAEIDALAELIYTEGAYCGDCGYGGWIMCADCRSVCRGYTEAILAAGYRKPRMIATVEELDALMDGSVIRDALGTIREMFNDPETDAALWFRTGGKSYVLSGHFAGSLLPATVLFEPSRSPHRA